MSKAGLGSVAALVLSCVGGLVGGCDEREAEPIEEARSCLGEDPAAYADREEQTLLAEAQPEHPQCNGEVATEPGGEDVLCDANVEAWVDEAGTTVKVSSATFAIGDIEAPREGPLGLAIALPELQSAADGEGQLQVTCTSSCPGGCTMSGCVPKPTGCSAFTCKTAAGGACDSACSQVATGTFPTGPAGNPSRN